MLRRTTRVLMGCITKGMVHFLVSLSWAGIQESFPSGPLHDKSFILSACQKTECSRAPKQGGEAQHVPCAMGIEVRHAILSPTTQYQQSALHACHIALDTSPRTQQGNCMLRGAWIYLWALGGFNA